MSERVLVVASHPDDETLGCGGTIRKLADDGHEVYVYTLGAGRPARTFGERTAQQEVQQSALDILGAKLVTADAPPLADNAFDTEGLLGIVQRVESAVDAITPAAIYSHWEGCLNIDHQLTARAVRTAAVRRPFVRQVFAFEVLSSSEWARDTFRPTTYADVTKTMHAKIAAMACYSGELKYGRTEAGVMALAAYRGLTAGYPAEAFEVVFSR